MAMETSILKSVKKVLNIDPTLTHFDEDVLMQINMALATANQIGVGEELFYIEGDDATWESLSLPSDQLSMLKTYLFLKVKGVFDPDATSFTQEARRKQIEELESRLYIAADEFRHPLPEEVA